MNLLKSVSLVLIYVSTNLYSQDLRRSNFEILIGGSSVKETTTPDDKKYVVTQIGFSGGIGLTQKFNKYLELQLRVLWERKGNKVEFMGYPPAYPPGTIVYTLVDQKKKLDYLTFSFVPRFVFGKSRQFSVGVGAYFAQMYGAKYVIEADNLKQPIEANIFPSYKHTDLGLSFSLGYKIPSTKKHSVSFQLIESKGLTQTNLYPQQNNQHYNTSYSLLMGISF